MSTTSSPGPSQAPAAVGYFVDQKKGEVNELKLVYYSFYKLIYKKYFLNRQY